jgi:hypothetical protein
VNDGTLVEAVHRSHDAILEFMFGGDTDVAEDGAWKKSRTTLEVSRFEAAAFLRVGHADGINATYCKLLHRADGYCYVRQPALPRRPEKRGFQRGRF